MMSRLQQELSGSLGEFWKRHAEEEIAKLAERAEDEIRTTISGAAFWASNGNFLPSDVCEKLSYTDFPFSLEETAKAREEQTAAFLEDYRKNHRTSEEERMEMQAAFGKGTTVVDIISGQKIRL